MPSHSPRPPPPHTYLWGRPVHPQLRLPPGHEQLLALGPEMDHQRLFRPSNLHPIRGGLPPPHHLLLQIQETPGRSQCLLRSPDQHSSRRQAPGLLPISLDLQGRGLMPTSYTRLLLGLPPPRLANSRPIPSDQKTLAR